MDRVALKHWLYRWIVRYAAEQSDNAEQMSGDAYYEVSADSVQRIANYVQRLSDTDERLTRLAAVLPDHWTASGDLPLAPSLGSALAGFPSGGDPDRFLTDWIDLQVGAWRTRPTAS